MRRFKPPVAGLLGLVFPLAAFGFGTSQEEEPPSIPEVNKALGIPLFLETSLWEEDADAVADRLGWPRESKTSSCASYRKYPFPSQTILGRNSYAMTLLADDGNPSSISILFANKGDVDRMVQIDHTLPEHRQQREMQRAIRNLPRMIREDASEIASTLDELFGSFSWARTGDSRQTAEQVRRWDWEGHAFLLAAPRNEYAVLRIVSVESLEESTGRISRRVLREKLSQRVERRENGDVILSDMPMVDQGPKGYCVPATWERVLRYMGIPADMNVLAMAGSTDAARGTYTRELTSGVAALLRRHMRQFETSRSRVNASSVARYIDNGLPIMWTMSSLDEWNAEISERTNRREKVEDWEAWKKELEPIRRGASRKWRVDQNYGHVCMIIGYNSNTGEVAVSDSWGPEYEERWMTFEEAEAISMGEWMIIQP